MKPNNSTGRHSRPSAGSLLFALLLCAAPLSHAGEEAPPAKLQQIETLQRRAEKLVFDALDPASYHLAKARAWLDLALSEYHEKDTTGILESAVGQAESLLDALDSKSTSVSMRMPQQTPGSETVRPDLWDKIAALKGLEKFPCGQRPLATAEVYLVWAGHEFHEEGQSHAESYMRAVENLVYEAKVAIDNCVDVPAQTPLLSVTTLSGDALFAFDQSTLNPNALWRLDNVVENIRKVKQLEEVMLVGHTDHMRSDRKEERNQQLSERRAETIKKYLVNKGIPADKIRTKGAGSSQPVVQCPANQSRAKQIACLQPNRRVEIILRGGNAAGDNKANDNKEPAK
jgi:outer membrane protein OmpA-like peptidoglycan-associated protein